MAPARMALTVLCSIAVLWGCSRDIEPAAPSRDTRPNIILFMADDLGFETLGVNGSASYRTPALDARSPLPASASRTPIRSPCARPPACS